MADRYCRNCGHKLRPEDRFCTGCGRAIRETAHVPTPEANVPVPPPSPPPQAPGPTQQERQPDGVRDATRGPTWGMLVVFLILGTVKTAQGMPPASSGEDFAYRLGMGMAVPLVLLFFLAALLLLIGGVYYVTARKDGVTFGEAVFNWPLVILAGVVALLSLPS